jgi:acyl-coenzyme A thioesterase 13
MSEIPEGFSRVQRPQPNPFNELVGPFYSRRAGDAISLGMRIEARHCNSRGICHGGLLATLADVALGYACVAAGSPEGKSNSFVTTNLSVDYLAPAHVGDWVQSDVKVLNPGSRTATANGFLVANGNPIVRASATFRMLKARAPDPAGSPEN